MGWEFEFLYALQGMHTPVMDQIMLFLSFLGNAGLLWILIGVILLCFPKYRRGGIQMLVAIAVAFVVGNLILKNVVARERPCWLVTDVELLLQIPKDYSFPSGHSMNGFVSAVSLFCIDKRMGIPALILAGLIAFSRLYLFVHFPTDVLAGILLGVCIALITDYIFVKKGWRKPIK